MSPQPPLFHVRSVLSPPNPLVFYGICFCFPIAVMKSPLPLLPSSHIATSNAQLCCPFQPAWLLQSFSKHCVLFTFLIAVGKHLARLILATVWGNTIHNFLRKAWPWERLMPLTMEVGSGWVHDLCSQKKIKLSPRPGRNLQGHPSGTYLLLWDSTSSGFHHLPNPCQWLRTKLSVHRHGSVGTFHIQAITQRFAEFLKEPCVQCNVDSCEFSTSSWLSSRSHTSWEK